MLLVALMGAQKPSATPQKVWHTWETSFLLHEISTSELQQKQKPMEPQSCVCFELLFLDGYWRFCSCATEIATQTAKIKDIISWSSLSGSKWLHQSSILCFIPQGKLDIVTSYHRHYYCFLLFFFLAALYKNVFPLLLLQIWLSAIKSMTF